MNQFLLLFRKNLIIWRRNKLWTFFEIILPCVLTLLYLGIFVGRRSLHFADTNSLNFRIQGNVYDISTSVNYCSPLIRLAYSSSSTCKNESTKIMNIMEDIFTTSHSYFELTEEPSEDSLEKKLRDAVKEYSFAYRSHYFCELERIGIYFDEIDFDKQILKYRLIYANSDGNWLLEKRSAMSNGFGKKFATDYERMGFLTFQHAIETSFINIINNSKNQFTINFQSFPELEVAINLHARHLSIIPYLLSIFIFTNVIHVTREISAENEHLKGYLMTLGLSNFNFYLTHILSGLLKSSFLFFITIMAFWINESSYINHIFTLSMILFLYGLSAITFGAFIASFFSTSDSAVKASITFWAILLGILFLFKPENHQEIFKCHFYSLNPIIAFSLSLDILAELIVDAKSLNIFNIFSGFYNRFTLGNAISMLIFDIILMFGISIFVDNYRRSNDVSLIQFITSLFASKNIENIKMSELQASEDLLDEDVSNENRNEDENGIIVSKLVKIWKTTGEKAINGLSFEAKRGEVTILFGQNGDGKSTTFHCIAGMIPPTQGRVIISGRESNLRPNIGLCPQYNPIIDQLTVEEHLWFINGLKGNRENRKFRSEMNRLLENVNLMDKKHEFSSNLSGGMKRKLCVCMALIGSSEIVLLDEPTAGMDTGARKDVQNLLEIEKQERTILLTTHYMDEAERLGDWILIMSHGKLVSSGTTKLLKQKYGSGYLLTVVLDDNNDRDRISEVLEKLCQFYISEAKIGNKHGKQIEVILPENRKSDFPILFRALETVQRKEFSSEIFFILPSQLKDKLRILQITNYGLSLNTLEQVILTISEKFGSSETDGIVNQNHEFEAKKFENLLENQSNLLPVKQGIPLFLSQISAIFRKKYMYTKRRWSQLVGQLFIPLMIIALIWLISKMKVHEQLKPDSIEKSYDLQEFSPAAVIWRNPMSENDLKMKKIVERASLGFENHIFDKSETLLNISAPFHGKIPSLLFGFAENTTLFDYRNQHIIPSLITLNNQARLWEGSDIEKVPKIECQINFHLEKKYDDLDNSHEVLIAFFIVIFSLVTSSFVLFLVEEKVSKFAHQQLLTGISPITMYATSMIFDFLVFSAICLIFLVFFYLFDFLLYRLGIIIFSWFLYFISNVPFIYLSSQYFKSPSKARVFLVIWQIFIASALLLIRGIWNDYFAFILECICSFFVPAFSFGNTLIETMKPSFSQNYSKYLTFMVLSAIVPSILFVVLQFKTVQKYLSSRKINERNQQNENDFKLSDSVVQEKQKARNANPLDYSLVVKNLTKKYGNFTALNDLSFTISKNECFGLLGVNGCGKTTTFDILTGYSFGTSGEAKIGGKDVTERIGIGYCPQFDSNYQQKADIILESIGMQKHSNKLIRYYSGGQKRKISIGIAILSSNQSMIILDEPTAGIDPKARREIWELLIWARENYRDSAIMLTSHSMDECEALCSRIAVLNRGKLIAIGSSQELKSLYGNTYTMTLTLNNKQDRQNIVKAINNQIPGAILQTPETNKTLDLVWLIPKSAEDEWSDKFEMVQNLARQLNLKDYILSQSSLEETFLQLARRNQQNLFEV
ncbi:unnamed protein product [Caenorhabditis angaria]|uniref:ABC transporter domain-containing protein n=1 Tax=Caenorhabditis angaria TaxID=860376 RepID=A0A9P1IQL4_9PELO|nr:unnamed protein product [Caenorhabditis angaria]